MQSLPNARLSVHPRGERHMVDPSALYAGAHGRVRRGRDGAQLRPAAGRCDRARVTVTADGTTLTLGTRVLEFMHTPGHARHHHCIWDARTRTWFTGDTFGLSYPQLVNHNGRWITPTCAPVQFEPEAAEGLGGAPARA